MATLVVISAQSVKQSLHASGGMDGSPMTLVEGLESFDVDGVMPVLSSASADFQGGESLAGIQDRLRLAGVPVVHVTTPFQEPARRGLAFHDYIYWRDDTHRNPRGVTLAADCVLAEIRKEPSLSATLELRTQGIASEVSRAAR